MTLLRLLVEHQGRGWVRSSTFQMKLDVIPSGREPDVVYLREEHLDRMTGTYIDGPADVAVEVVSTESGPRDRGEKFYEYEAAGIPEYWIVDPSRRQLEVYRLEEERYQVAFMGEEGRIDSAVLDGLWVRAEWFWRESLPAVLDVLAELDLV